MLFGKKDKSKDAKAIADEKAQKDQESVKAADKAVAVKSAKETESEQPKKPDHMTFVSAEPEAEMFPIMAGGKKHIPVWDKSSKRLIWNVPMDQAKAFKSHLYVKSGRIIRVPVDKVSIE